MSGALLTIQYILDPRLKLRVIKNVKKKLEGTANQARVLNLLRIGKFETKQMHGGKVIACYDEENDVKKSIKFDITYQDFMAIRKAIRECRQKFNTTNKSNAFAFNENIRDNEYHYGTGEKHENSIRTNFWALPIEKFYEQCAENLSWMKSPQDVYDFFELYTEFEHTKLDNKYEHIFVHRDILFKFIKEFISEAGVGQVDNMPGEAAYAKMCKIIQDWVRQKTGVISEGLEEMMENFQTFMSMGIKGLLRLDIIKDRHTKTISRLREAHANNIQHIEKVIHEKDMRDLNQKVKMQGELRQLASLNKESFETNEKLREENQKIQQDLRAEQTLLKTLKEKCESEKDKYEEMLKEKDEVHEEIEALYRQTVEELQNFVFKKEKELEEQKANNEKLGQEISEKEKELRAKDRQKNIVLKRETELQNKLVQEKIEKQTLQHKNDAERQKNQAEIEKLKTTIREKEDGLKTQNQENTAARERLQIEITDLKQKQISAQAELQLSQIELSETKEKLEQNANEKKDIEDQKIFLESQIEDIQRKLDENQKTSSAENRDMKEILENWRRTKINLESLLENEKIITTRLQSENDDLKEQLDTDLKGMLGIQEKFTNDLQHLERLLTETEDEKFALEKKLRNSEDHNEFMRKLEYVEQSSRYEETENRLKGEIQQLKEHNDNLKAEIDALRKFEEEVSTDNFDSRQVRARLQDQLDQLEKEDEELQILDLDLKQLMQQTEDQNGIEEIKEENEREEKEEENEIEEIEDEKQPAPINFFHVFEQVFNLNAAKQDEIQKITRRNQDTYTAQQTSEIEASKQKMIDDYFENGQLKSDAISKLVFDLKQKPSMIFKKKPCTLLPNYMKDNNEKNSGLVIFFAKAFVSDNFGKPIFNSGRGGNQIGYEIGTTIAKNNETNHYYFLCTTTTEGNNFSLQTPKNTKKFDHETVLTDQKDPTNTTRSSSANMAPGHFYPPYVPCANRYYFPSNNFSVMHSQPQKYCADQVYYIVVANAQPNSHNFNF